MSLFVFHNAFGDQMNLVAVVETDRLEHAYEVTNSIDTPWYSPVAPGVIAYQGGEGGVRSTSIGDFLYMVESGKWFRVEPFGFAEVKPDQLISVEQWVYHQLSKSTIVMYELIDIAKINAKSKGVLIR